MTITDEVDLHWRAQFKRDGFTVVERVIDRKQVTRLIQAIEGESGARVGADDQRAGYALRHLHRIVPEVRALAESVPVRAWVEAVLGPNAFVARSLYFDKTPDANWKVPWHQDLTIAVRQRIEVAGFGPWSVKEGVPHVQPPVSVLERMLTLRLHLDDCDADNGPLQVLPGSHRGGRLTAEAVQRWRVGQSPVICVAKRGGAVLMRPLLLHSSSPAKRPCHRRVIHLEFAADPVPGGLEWCD